MDEKKKATLKALKDTAAKKKPAPEKLPPEIKPTQEQIEQAEKVEKRLALFRSKLILSKETRARLDKLPERPGSWTTVYNWIAFIKEVYELLLIVFDSFEADDPAETEKEE